METAFFATIGTRRAAVTGSMTAPEPVVRAALRALDRGRGYLAPGLGNTLAAHLTPRRPRTLVVALAERIPARSWPPRPPPPRRGSPRP
ncbi:hypothetical protein [Streptomyces sp. NPDC085529]|uniref:hypothetical protein n=1 Tax=Streptomyces sp. NPDC085529 TaxID=3365729 RepID=UPI0037D3A0F6